MNGPCPPFENHMVLIRKELGIHLAIPSTFFSNILCKWSLIFRFWVLPEIRDYLPQNLIPYLETLLEIFALCCTEIFIFLIA